MILSFTITNHFIKIHIKKLNLTGVTAFQFTVSVAADCNPSGLWVLLLTCHHHLIFVGKVRVHNENKIEKLRLCNQKDNFYVEQHFVE